METIATSCQLSCGKENANQQGSEKILRIRSAGFPQMKYLHELVMEDMPEAGSR